MLFYEPLFLFAFLPTFYLAYLIVQRHGAVILLASVLFYFWSEPLFVPVVLLSAVLDHALGLRIARARQGSYAARIALAIGVVSNLAVLGHYKYTRFLVANLDALLSGLHVTPLFIPEIALPIGVSFIVFEKITYLVDIERRISRPAPDFATYLVYVFFFPKLLAGPIIKYHEMEQQLRGMPRAQFDDFCAGMQRFTMGMAKKTLLADTLATGADMIFRDPVPGFREAWWGVLFFTFQIYFDFSAYSDMAIGLARMLGFRLRENFNMPYISCSISEFWHRWHISLSTWIREYLYIPLGGNRVPVGRRYLNLWICFLASGFWHGAAWTYVVWGAYNGLFLMLDKLFLLRLLDRLPRIAANAFAFAVVVIGWTIFRATSLEQAARFLEAMVQPTLPATLAGVFVTNDMKLALAAAILICVAQHIPACVRLREIAVSDGMRGFAIQSALALLFVAALGKALADPFHPFIYFRF